jgi:uncharacterized protein YdaL
MSEIEKVKQTVTDDLAAIEVEKRKAIDALNREQSWVETHPKTVTVLGVVLLFVIIAMLAKAYG